MNTSFCIIHLVEDNGTEVPAKVQHPEYGPICAECSKDLYESLVGELKYQAGYAYACGYYD